MKKRSRQISIAGAETDFLQQAQKMVYWWKNSPLKLIWTTPEACEHLTQQLAQKITQSQLFQQQTKQLSKQLRAFDIQINKKIEPLKKAIINTGDNKYNTAIFSDFGIVKQAGMYKLPMKRHDRLKAMQQLVKATIWHNLKNDEYGYPYWLNIMSQYAMALNDFEQTENYIQRVAQEKKHIRWQLDKIMRSYAKLQEINYPESAVCRLIIAGLIPTRE